MQTFDFRGLPIRYAKEGTGAPVVFLHNGGTSHVIWCDVIPRLSAKYQCLALDLLGFGASAKPESGYGLADYEAMLAHFVDREVRGPVALVGNCMGSAIALRFAMRRPKAVQALVLINPLTEATFLAGGLGAMLWMKKRAPGVLQPLRRSLSRLRLPRFIAEQSLRFQLGREGRARKLQSNEDLCACGTSESHLPSLLRVFDDLESYASLDAWVRGEGFPYTCTIWGLENRVLSAAAGRQLNRTLRPDREEWLEGCGHLPMLERPEVVAGVIEEVLDLGSAPATRS